MSTATTTALIEEICRFLKQRRAASFEEIGAVLESEPTSVEFALKEMSREGLVELRKSHLDRDTIAVSTDRLLRSR